MSYHLQEFLTIVVIHFLAVASPGPDFAVVVRQVVSHGRQYAMFTSIGVGCGILIHVAYCLIGIGLIINQTPQLFSLFKYAAAAYLLYIGFQALTSKAKRTLPSSATGRQMTVGKAFTMGFVTNGLNPKATLFFLSLFAVVINPVTSIELRLAYGLYMAVATALWFCLVAFLLSTKVMQDRLLQKGVWLDRAMGVVLIALAAQLALSDYNQVTL